MATDIIKEFVVALGWKNDEVSQKKIMENVAKFEKGLVALGTAATAATLGVVAGLERMGKAFEDAYYSSSRTGASVREMNAFKYAAAQMGSSADEAQQAIEGLARKMRESKGWEGVLRSLGATDPKNTVKALNDIAPRLAAMSMNQAEAYAKALNIPENLLLALRKRGEFQKFEAESQKKYNILGFDPEKAAEDGRSLERVFRNLYDTLSKIAEKTASGLFNALQPSIESLNSFLLANGQQISDTLVAIGNAILNLARELSKFLASDDMTKFFKSFGDPDNWKDVKEGFGWLVRQLQEIRTLVKDIARFSNWLDKMTGLHLPGQTSDAGAGGGDPMALANGPYAKPNTVGGKIVDAYRNSMPRFLGGRDKSSHRRPGMLSADRAANADAIIKEMRAAGYNDNAISAVIGSMQTESGLNPTVPENSYNHGHNGLWQWDSTRWPKIVSWIKEHGGDPSSATWQARAWIAEHNAKPGDKIYDGRSTEAGGAILRGNPSLPDAVHGVRLSERFGPGEEGGRAANAATWLPKVRTPARPLVPAIKPGTALPLFHPDNTSGLKSPYGGFNPDAMRGLFKSPGLGTSGNDASRHVSMTNSPNITVTGVSDPTAAAAMIGARMDKSHSLLLKNVQSAIG